MADNTLKRKEDDYECSMSVQTVEETEDSKTVRFNGTFTGTGAQLLKILFPEMEKKIIIGEDGNEQMKERKEAAEKDGEER